MKKQYVREGVKAAIGKFVIFFVGKARCAGFPSHLHRPVTPAVLSFKGQTQIYEPLSSASRKQFRVFVSCVIMSHHYWGCKVIIFSLSSEFP